jgi:hypothetical protein
MRASMIALSNSGVLGSPTAQVPSKTRPRSHSGTALVCERALLRVA